MTSFVDAFYSFTVELSDSDRGVYTQFRVKTAKHPYEDLEHLYARMIAMLCSYTEGLSFSQGLSAPNEPVAWERNEIDDVVLWVEIGCPDKKKLRHSLSENDKAQHRVYFYDRSHIGNFCHQLRGSKTNWVQGVKYFYIPPELIESILPTASLRSNWIATISDGTLFLQIDNVELVGEIDPIDIWSHFQESIKNADA